MTDMTPSPAAIIYAAADLFAPPPHLTNGFQSVPCTELKVAPWDLAVQLICVSLAEMIAQDTVTLQIVEATKLFVIHTKNVVMHITPGAEDRLPQTGVAGWLTPSILAHNGDNIHNIVWAAFGTYHTSPASVLIEMARQELVSLGCYADTVQEIGGMTGKVLKALHGDTTEHVMVPLCERFASLRASAASVQQLLQSASAHDPGLWEMLHKQVSHAMSARVEHETPPVNNY